ncbi:MAG: hypothetical protein AAF404_03400 [Pseudomonadota bacterium]
MTPRIQAKHSLVIGAAMAAQCAVTANAFAADNTLQGLQSRIIGEWQSISCELRPAPDQSNPQGKPVPTYLKRHFHYDKNGGFSATITVFADNTCQMPVFTYDFAGELAWHGPNPAAEGAWSQDYILNKSLNITVNAKPALTQLNSLPQGACGDSQFSLNEPKDILGKPCVLLKFIDGNPYVVDHDFLYVREDTPNMLFMGGKHVDGEGFYYPEHRPVVGLQQPLIKVQ